MRLVLASRNPHKLREWKAALPDWEIVQLAGTDEPIEDGETFVENALVKARHGARRTPTGWVVGEDAGIEVVALGGRPGIESARWAADGVARLLRELEGVDDRRARYVCAAVALANDGSEMHASGLLAGVVAHERRGSEGFGYDPIFVPTGETQTVAELGDGWKAEHSARARAARALADMLAETVVASADGREPGTH